MTHRVIHTLSEPLQKALNASGIKSLTAVQKSLLPPAFERRDVLAVGPGLQGLADAMAVIYSARVSRATGKIVLAILPESSQAEELFQKTSEIVSDCSGMVLLTPEGDFDEQEKALDQGSRILVATPKGLYAHLKIGNISLSSTEFLLVNELDALISEKISALAMNEILRFMPRTRQTVAIAKEMTAVLNKNLSKILKDPVKVAIVDEASPARKSSTKRVPPRQPKPEAARRATQKSRKESSASVGGVA
jgi:superfamily II DNA/RNA helicase